MAIFSSKKKNPVPSKMEKVPATPLVRTMSGANTSDVLIRPRITEKATDQLEKNTYVFEIAHGAQKKQVANAVHVIYKVKPIKVRIANNPSKRVFVRGKRGLKTGVRKAYVELKKGDKIEFV